MKKIKLVFLLLLFIAFLFAVKGEFSVFKNINASTQNVSTPTIFDIISGKEARVTGLTEKNTNVLIYVDGTFAGNAQVNRGSETDDFYYYFNREKNLGKHKFMVIAQDKTSLVLSPPSKEFSININYEVVDNEQNINTDNISNKKVVAPTLIIPKNNFITSNLKPEIKGLVKNGTRSLIYIDGKLNGKTNILVSKTGTGNFTYRPFLNLSKGWHTVWSVAEDNNGQKSIVSNKIKIKIEDPAPAPVLTKIIKIDSAKEPIIYGVAKNDSLVKFYINKKLIGQFKVKNNPSGTASIYFRLSKGLVFGNNIIYATITDTRGKESPWSNIISYQNKKPRISIAAAKEINQIDSDKDGLIDYDEINKYKTDPNKSDTDGDGYNDKEEIANGYSPVIHATKDTSKKIAKADDTASDVKGEKEFSGDKSSTTATTQTESNEEDSVVADNSKTKVIIFSIFIIAVIAWIVWVNRELIRERKNKETEIIELPESINDKEKK